MLILSFGFLVLLLFNRFKVGSLSYLKLVCLKNLLSQPFLLSLASILQLTSFIQQLPTFYQLLNLLLQ